MGNWKIENDKAVNADTIHLGWEKIYLQELATMLTLFHLLKKEKVNFIFNPR